jgi:hypothetical protein
MSSCSPGGGRGGPGEACVKCGVNETTLGAHAPTSLASPKKESLKMKTIGVWCAKASHFSEHEGPQNK